MPAGIAVLLKASSPEAGLTATLGAVFRSLALDGHAIVLHAGCILTAGLSIKTAGIDALALLTEFVGTAIFRGYALYFNDLTAGSGATVIGVLGNTGLIDSTVRIFLTLTFQKRAASTGAP